MFASGEAGVLSGEKSAERWDPGVAGSAEVFMKSRRLPGSLVRRKKDLLCPSTTSLAPLLWLLWEAALAPEAPGCTNLGDSFGMLEAPPNQRHVTKCHQRRRRRGSWFMTPFIHGEQRALGCCKDIFEEPDPVSFLEVDAHWGYGPYPSGGHVRMPRATAPVEDQINGLRCQTP